MCHCAGIFRCEKCLFLLPICWFVLIFSDNFMLSFVAWFQKQIYFDRFWMFFSQLLQYGKRKKKICLKNNKNSNIFVDQQFLICQENKVKSKELRPTFYYIIIYNNDLLLIVVVIFIILFYYIFQAQSVIFLIAFLW